MAITITLPNPMNVSLQAKSSNVIDDDFYNSGGWDVIYFIKIDNSTQKQVGDIKRIGICTGIVPGSNSYTIVIEPDSTAESPEEGDYIFFGKDNKIGTAGIKGYHAVVEMKNDSEERAELYCVASEISLSSK